GMSIGASHRAVPVEPAATIPAPPSLGRAVRQAAGDFYYNSWRVVPANLAWGALLLAILAMAGLWSALALLALPLLALPYAGMARLAALIARGEMAGLGDAFTAWRRYPGPALALGAGILLATVLLGFNVWYAVADGGVPAVAIGTASAWGLAVLAAFAVVAWPLLVDPAREDAPVRGRLRLAGLLLLAHPGRMLCVAAVVVVLLAVSTAAFAALLTVSVAFSALVAARYVLPAADRLEARLAARGR
ncbi:MAG TPA: hypothetical protein VIR16_08670, partial [Candidatus Limnocylindrales bacterium]